MGNKFSDVTVKVIANCLSTHLYALTLSGCDVVFGVPWGMIFAIGRWRYPRL